MSDQIRVSVAALTFRRPDQIDELLTALEPLIGSISGYDVDIVVVDNDPDGSARRVVEGRAGVRYVVEAEPGISAARNRALDEAAGFRLLVFIDDDELPDGPWLEPLLRTWAATEASVVSGRVRVEFDRSDPWFEAGGFFARRSLPTGTRIDVASTNNLLLDLDRVRESGVRFDPRFGLSGGEDTLFTRTLCRRGHCMVWCDESVVLDRIPPERMSHSWALRRAWSHGNSSSAVRVQLHGSSVRPALAIGGAGRVVAGGLRLMVGMVTRSVVHRARGSRLAHRGGGMVAAAFGSHYQEYRRN